VHLIRKRGSKCELSGRGGRNVSYMAEDERKRIKERQEEGIKLAISKGVKFGRKKIEIDENFISTYNDWKQNKMTAVEGMKKTGMKSNTFYRRVKEYESNVYAQ